MIVPINIRIVNPETELEAIESIAKEIWKEHYIPIIGIDAVNYMLDKYQSAEAIANQIQEGTEYYKIIFKAALTGYFSVVQKENSLFLSKLYVAKEMRGKGLARKAMEYITSIAHKKGCNTISLTVNKDNTVAIKTYEKFGFKNIKSQIIDIGNGFVMDDYVMVKYLG